MIATIKIILDILVVALFVNIAVTLLRRTHSLFIVRGMFVIFAIYLLALVLSLSLTTLILRFIFSFFVIILVVIFQKEFRRFFEELSLSVSRPFRGEMLRLEKNFIRMLMQSVTYLSKKKIGALIVFVGDLPIDHLLSEGEKLDGTVSEPLLLSIFDPSSPGHDGAVIIDGMQLVRFGTHLPLSDNYRAYEKFGTRHRSALGLSERSDAIVVVVSEEKGTVSYAANGRLVSFSKPEELEEKLDLFYNKKYPENMKQWWHNLFLEQRHEKVLSLAFSVALWFFFSSRF